MPTWTGDQDEINEAMRRWLNEKSEIMTKSLFEREYIGEFSHDDRLDAARTAHEWRRRAVGYDPGRIGINTSVGGGGAGVATPQILDQPGQKLAGIEVGHYYAVDTGWTAFRVDSIDTLRNTVDVTYYPSGSTGHWAIQRLVDIGGCDHQPFRCPKCEQQHCIDFAPADPGCSCGAVPAPCPNCENSVPTCKNCGWTTNDIELPEEEIPMAQETLYRLLDEKKETYCTRLSTDSRGRAVVEIKGSGEIRAVEPKNLEEVLPYTVGIKFLADSGGKVYSYLADDGELAAGDLLIGEDGRGLATVTKVNTKSRAANKRFKGWKVAATKLAEVEAEFDPDA